MKHLIALSFFISSSVFAQGSIETKWTKDLEVGLDKKQQKAMALISLINTKMNHTPEDNNRIEELEYAQVGFSARFQNIREDRIELAHKEAQMDYATVQIYSKRLDVLINDLQTFLK